MFTRLCFRHRFLTSTLKQHRDFEVVFLIKIYRCTNIITVLFSQKYANCFVISFFDKQNLFSLHKKWSFPADLVMFTEEICNGKLYFLCSVCMRNVKRSLNVVYIWKFAARCLNSEKGFLTLCSSLIRINSLFSGGKFSRIVVSLLSL